MQAAVLARQIHIPVELAGPPWRPISDGVRFHDRQIRSQAELTQQHLRFIADLSADPTTQWTEIEVGEAASRVHSGSAVDEGLEVAGDPDSLSRQATLSGKDPDQCEVDHIPERFLLGTALFSPRGTCRGPRQDTVACTTDRSPRQRPPMTAPGSRGQHSNAIGTVSTAPSRADTALIGSGGWGVRQLSSIIDDISIS